MQVKDKVKICTIDGKKSKEVDAIFDTGSKNTYINEIVGDKLGYKKYLQHETVSLATKDTNAEIIGIDAYKIEICKCKMPSGIRAEVMKNLDDDMIIGTDIMENFDIELDLKEGKPKLKRCPPKLRLV